MMQKFWISRRKAVTLALVVGGTGLRPTPFSGTPV